MSITKSNNGVSLITKQLPHLSDYANDLKTIVMICLSSLCHYKIGTAHYQTITVVAVMKAFSHNGRCKA